jgi:hypothetical protein
MSDEKIITTARETMITEILGDVSGLENQVQLIYAELVACNKELKEELKTALSAIRAQTTAEKNDMAKNAAKLVREGVYGEIGGLKTEVKNLISELQGAADELRSRKHWDFMAYVVLSSIGVALATLLVENVILTH